MNSTAHSLSRTTAFRTVAVVLSSLTLALGLTACGGNPGVEGTYTGSAGTTMLVLKGDGSALYSQQKRAGLETGAGTWSVDDGVLRVDVDSLSYEIFANADGFDGTLLVESDSSSWNEEIYTRQE
ncbi:hypothetical protein [Brevibacterium yomogidense]|uniref:hypothetical protein n=1 Tax=Brevibacterium yomogidense TaxID=946573 RepID=UPI0018E03D8D|nr:hypothetical protein [Brevibacterium yomogidense]